MHHCQWWIWMVLLLWDVVDSNKPSNKLWQRCPHGIPTIDTISAETLPSLPSSQEKPKNVKRLFERQCNAANVSLLKVFAHSIYLLPSIQLSLAYLLLCQTSTQSVMISATQRSTLRPKWLCHDAYFETNWHHTETSFSEKQILPTCWVLRLLYELETRKRDAMWVQCLCVPDDDTYRLTVVQRASIEF